MKEWEALVKWWDDLSDGRQIVLFLASMAVLALVLSTAVAIAANRIERERREAFVADCMADQKKRYECLVLWKHAR